MLKIKIAKTHDFKNHLWAALAWICPMVASLGCASRSDGENEINQRFGSLENASRLVERKHDVYCDLMSEIPPEPAIARYGFAEKQEWIDGRSRDGNEAVKLHELKSTQMRGVVEEAYVHSEHRPDQDGNMKPVTRHALKLKLLSGGPTVWIGIRNIHTCDVMDCYAGDHPLKFRRVDPGSLRSVVTYRKCSIYH